jgi:hypothetical protein
MDNRVSTTQQHHRNADPQKKKGHFSLGFLLHYDRNMDRQIFVPSLREGEPALPVGSSAIVLRGLS